MHNCYICGILFDKNIYKAYDKSLCSKTCQQKLINNYIYTHEFKIVNKKDYYYNLNKEFDKNSYNIYINTQNKENKENTKNESKNLIYYNFNKSFDINSYNMYINTQNKENTKNISKNLIYYKFKNILYFFINIIKIISPL